MIKIQFKGNYPNIIISEATYIDAPTIYDILGIGHSTKLTGAIHFISIAKAEDVVNYVKSQYN